MSNNRPIVSIDRNSILDIDTRAKLKSHQDSELAHKELFNQKADVSSIPTSLSQLSEDENHRLVTDSQKSTWNSKATSASVTAVSNRVTAIEEKESSWDAKQSAITPGTGFVFDNNTLNYDPEVLPTVEYVDATITDVMLYIDQQDASEHAGRVAGDNLKVDINQGVEFAGKVLGIGSDGKVTPVEGGSGGGLPDPTPYEDGTALIKVGNEWKAQSGYGYEGEPAFEPIAWDGSTEGRATVDISGITYYKVSDYAPTIDELIGASWIFQSEGSDVSGHLTAIDIVESTPGIIVAEILGNEAAIFVSSDTDLGEGIIAHKGTYYFIDIEYGDYVSSIAAPSSVTTIDPKFIPQSGVDEFVVTFEMDATTEEITSDKTIEEIYAALTAGKKICGELYTVSGVAKMFTAELYTTMADSGKFYSSPKFNTSDNELLVYRLRLNDDDEWEIDTYTYTLTPASTE